jgi:protein-tyrosine phosphatase
MIDLHVHLLPGLDDGPQSLEESVAMCRMAAADGVTTIVATPHQQHEEWENADIAEIHRLCREVETAAAGTILVLPGGEIRASMGIPADLERGEEGGLLPLAGSRYVLVEPSPYPFAPSLEELIYELRVAGWRTILAHPERYGYLAEETERLRVLVKRGALLQVTAASVLGANGRRAEAATRYLLQHRLAHFLSSDGHDCAGRAPLLAEAARKVASQWGEDLARVLTLDNPLAVIEDRELPSEAN